MTAETVEIATPALLATSLIVDTDLALLDSDSRQLPNLETFRRQDNWAREANGRLSPAFAARTATEPGRETRQREDSR